MRGEVDFVSGTCPAIVFVLKGRTVYTTASTAIKGGPCRDVKKGADVTVKGYEMSDSRVRADEIRMKDDDDDDDA